MEISTLQIIAIFLFSCIAGMGSVLDEFQTHRPLNCLYGDWFNSR